MSFNNGLSGEMNEIVFGVYEEFDKFSVKKSESPDDQPTSVTKPPGKIIGVNFFSKLLHNIRLNQLEIFSSQIFGLARNK